MRFFISGEIDATVHDLYREARQLVEQRLNDALGEKEYGSALQTLAIIPIMMLPEAQSRWKERRLFQRKQLSADYRLYIDLEEFRSSGVDDRVRLLLKNLISAIQDLDRKAGSDFDGEALISDILAVFHFSRADLWLD